jgi:PfaD family protein
MFEMGVKVQVLKRGTMFAMRGQKLFDLYRAYPEWEAIPETDRTQVEKNLLKAGFNEIWNQTREFFSRRDPSQVEKGDIDPKHRMALVFRWYLGLSSRWANAGEAGRQLDYQVWCGPAMGAFNEWARGSILEPPHERTVTMVARNLVFGAALFRRWETARSVGAIPKSEAPFRPRPLIELNPWFA